MFNMMAASLINWTYRSHEILEEPLVPHAGLSLPGDLGHGLDADGGELTEKMIF